MRIVVKIIIGLIVCFNISAQDTKCIKYHVEILRWGYVMTGDDSWIITNDSIIISKSDVNDSFNDTIIHFSKKLSTLDQQYISAELKKIDLEKLEEVYVNNSAGDDMGEFDFNIKIGKKSKKIHIYQVRVDEIFNLVKHLNNYIPEEFKIYYTKEYFE